MIRELTPELANIAKQELNEDPKRLKDDLQQVKDWISKQPHLKARTDDQWLVAILRGCKFSLETFKKKFDLYYTLRYVASEVVLRLKPTEAKFIEFLRVGTCLILPRSKQSQQPRVILIRAVYDPDMNNVADIICVLYYLVQILLVEDDTATIVGTKIIVDYQGLKLRHIAQADPPLLRKIVAVCQDSMPLRLKGSHHVNVPSGVEMVFTIVKGFLNKKANDRMKICKSVDELLHDISKDVLPVEYGGTAGTVDDIIDYWANKVTEYKDWMKQEEHFGTDESKRVGKTPYHLQDTFGTEGTFRKLNLD